MINIYAYTYPSATKLYENCILTKVGESSRDVNIRINEQGGASEYESKIQIGSWNDLKTIKRDHDIHKILIKQGLHHLDGKGTEWFKIPGSTIKDVYSYIDDIISKFEGKRIRNKVKLRKLQKKALDEAISIINSSNDSTTIIANLCPRFGKTIWALSLFNQVSKKYSELPRPKGR